MRRVLSAKEYEAFLQSRTNAELGPWAASVADAAWEMIGRSNIRKVLFLCDDPLWQVCQLSGKWMKRIRWEVSYALLSRDDLPDLPDNVLICDMLFDPIEDASLSQKRRAWIEAMAASPCPVLSVAIPAGVDPDTGRAGVPVVHAEITVAPGAYLSGLFFHDGLDHCGKIWPVGGDSAASEGLCRFEEDDAKCLLPPRKRTAHKGDSGKALLCVGSPKYVGAALLSARACLAAGCGVLFVACPDVVREALWQLPEAIGVPVGTDWNGESCRIAVDALCGMTVLGIGCGVGGGDVSPLIEAALKTKRPLVLDADGLNCLSRHPELLALLHDRVVLTPHPGEMGRLTGLSPAQVQADPVALAAECARRWGCTVLLKGAATVVSDGQRTRIVAEGNAGLGKGGSGDVLTGIITGLMSQGVRPFDAASLGSYLLGASAEKAFELLKERMLRAANVVEALEIWNE